MTGYSSFFDQGAEVAGTLIGLLFVAISLSPQDRLANETPFSFRVQTTVAFTALVDALVVSMTALLPGDSVGTAALVVSATGLSTTVGLTVLGVRRWPGRGRLRDLVPIPFVAAAYLVQLLDAAHLLTGAGKPGALQTQAILVIVFFLIAIGRAWRLIGARDSRLLSAIAETAARHRADSTSDPEPPGRRGTTAPDHHDAVPALLRPDGG